MRTRMIRPAYWTDADLHTRLSADVREFYIGLWMLADDAGYVSWDVDRVGAELFPFRPTAWRRKRIPEWVSLLGSHVVVFACGRHLCVPNLPRFQSSPKPSYQNQRAHDSCLRAGATSGTTGGHMVPLGEHKPVVPQGATGDHKGPAQGVGIGLGVGIGKGAPGADEENEPTDGLKAKLGDFATIIGGKAS